MAVKKQKKPEIPEQHFASDKPTFCVYEIYRKSNKTVYYLQEGKAKQLSSITLDGFQGLPSGLYLNKNGYSFGKKGFFLLSALKEHLAGGKILELTISSKQPKRIQKTLHKVLVTLPFIDVKNLLVRLGRINEDNNSELRSAVASFLSTKFPKDIKISTDDFDEYKAGEIAALLRRKKVAQKLNEEDLESLNSFFPKIFEGSLKGKKRGVKAGRAALIKNTKTVTDKIFLDEVIKEFETNLAKKTLSENDWQKFLSEKVFRFLANYVTTVEKQNVSVSVDPGREERKALGIKSREEIAARLGIDIFNMAPGDLDKINTNSRDADRLREEEWLPRLIPHTERQTVFVCGFEHAKNFCGLLVSKGYKATVYKILN